MDPGVGKSSGGVERRSRLLIVRELAKVAGALLALYFLTYRIWPAALETWGSVQTSAVLVLEQPNEDRRAERRLAIGNAGSVYIRCEPAQASEKVFCVTSVRGDSGLLIYEIAAQAFGWKLKPAVENMRVVTGFSRWPLVNEALQWLIPCVALGFLAAWPTRIDFKRGIGALSSAPYLAITPVFLFSLALASAWASQGGFRLNNLGAYALVPILLGPLQEELLFRGVAYRYATHLRIPVLAQGVLVTGAFVALHASAIERHPMVAVWTTIGGFGLFWIRHHFQTLSLCISLHAAYNLLVINVFVPR